MSLAFCTITRSNTRYLCRNLWKIAYISEEADLIRAAEGSKGTQGIANAAEVEVEVISTWVSDKFAAPGPIAFAAKITYTNLSEPERSILAITFRGTVSLKEWLFNVYPSRGPRKLPLTRVTRDRKKVAYASWVIILDEVSVQGEEPAAWIRDGGVVQCSCFE